MTNICLTKWKNMMLKIMYLIVLSANFKIHGKTALIKYFKILLFLL